MVIKNPQMELVNALDEHDRVRAEQYAQDLLRGLKIVRTYPQGVTVFGSARTSEKDKYYQKARELGQQLAQKGHAVITGGGPGIMEAANRGAYEYGGRSIGLNITLRHEQQANPYLTDMVEFEYFFARRVMLTMSSKVYVAFPGGFGTLDEVSEVLVLMQEHKMPRMPFYFFGKSFWRPLDKFFQNKMVPAKLAGARDTHIYHLTDDIKDIIRAADHIGHPRVGTNYYDEFRKQVI